MPSWRGAGRSLPPVSPALPRSKRAAPERARSRTLGYWLEFPGAPDRARSAVPGRSPPPSPMGPRGTLPPPKRAPTPRATRRRAIKVPNNAGFAVGASLARCGRVHRPRHPQHPPATRSSHRLRSLRASRRQQVPGGAQMLAGFCNTVGNRDRLRVGEEVLDHPPPQRLAELGGFRQHVHQAFDGRGRIRAWAVRRPQHHDDLASLVRSDVEIRDQRASILVGISLQIILDPLVEFLMRAGELACQTTYDQSAEQILWDDIAPHRIASEGGNADRGVPFRAASPGNAKPLPG